MRTLDDISTPLLFLALVAVLVGNAVFSWHLPIWQPRNELAHYDFIDALSRGHWPAPGKAIGDDVFAATVKLFKWKRPPLFDGTRESMGVEGLSYESHQPPVYYLIMALPHAALRATGCPIAYRIRLLRLLQSCLVAAGIVLVFPIFASLRRSFGIEMMWGGIIACWMGLVNGVRYSSLGNDALSILACNLFLLFCALWHEKRNPRLGVAAGAAAAVAILTKYTNGLVLPVFAVVWLVQLFRDHPRPTRKEIAILLIPAMPVLAYLAFNAAVYGDPMRTGATKESFAHLVKGMSNSGTFLRILIADACCLTQFKILFPSWGYRLLGGLLLLSATLSLYRAIAGIDRARSLLNLACCILLAATLGSALALNAFRPGVRWEGFRHYAGLQLVFWWALLAGLPRCRAPAKPPVLPSPRQSPPQLVAPIR